MVCSLLHLVLMYLHRRNNRLLRPPVTSLTGPVTGNVRRRISDTVQYTLRPCRRNIVNGANVILDPTSVVCVIVC